MHNVIRPVSAVALEIDCVDNLLIKDIYTPTGSVTMYGLSSYKMLPLRTRIPQRTLAGLRSWRATRSCSHNEMSAHHRDPRQVDLEIKQSILKSHLLGNQTVSSGLIVILLGETIWGIYIIDFCKLNVLMETKGGKKSSSSSSSKSLFYEAPLGYSIEDVRPNGGIKKFRSAAYSNCARKPS
ncbi:hypothetical protein AgCh_029717 [Apium graveolens]